MVQFTTLQLEGYNKGQLRERCRERGINYNGLNVDGMRKALAEYAVEQVATEVAADMAAGAAVSTASLSNIERMIAEGEVPVPPREPKVLPDLTKVPVALPAAPKAARAPRADRAEANGVKEPSQGTRCREIWDWCRGVVANGGFPSAKDLRAYGSTEGRAWDATTCTVQYYRWRKFSGIQGR